jgi:hypothetical protein
MIGTQAEYARHIGVTKQAVGKMVKEGRIPIRPDRKIDFAEADFARAQNGDPARQQAGQAPTSTELPPPDDAGDVPHSGSGKVTYNAARTVREGYAAKLAKLEYEKQLGQVLPRQEVEDAMVASGRRIRQGLDGIVTWSEELDAAARNGGADAVRALLKEKVRGLETMIVDSLNLLADDG